MALRANHAALSVSEGLVAHSEATLSALQKMYYFQVFNVFLLSIVAGSLLTIASDIGDNPSGIASELGESIPRVGTFFINYVMIQGRSFCLQSHSSRIGVSYTTLSFLISHSFCQPRSASFARDLCCCPALDAGM